MKNILQNNNLRKGIGAGITLLFYLVAYVYDNTELLIGGSIFFLGWILLVPNHEPKQDTSPQTYEDKK